MADGRHEGDAGAHPGRNATKPTEIPPRGWREVLVRVWHATSEDNLGLISAALAYYAIFAIFPALAMVVSVWGLFADPAVLEQELTTLAASLPGDVATLIGGQLRDIAGASGGALGLTAIVAFLVSLWSASQGVVGLMSALNLVYDEKERRGYLRRTLVGFGLTLAGVVFVILSFGLLAVLPAVLAFVGLGDVGETLLAIGRWPLLAAGVVGFLALLFRYAPSRATPKWQWASPGALLATLLWLAGSAAFTLYVARFGSYNETYGALGAAIVFLLWLYLTGYVILLGGELNAELERQTAEDSTTGPPRPMGERGAFVADHLPDSS